jgi:arsenite methyltransferase
MKLVEVFDPPMCCSTGVCGPAVDPVLPRFAADLEWLKQQGVSVRRYNPAQQPQAFAGNPQVVATLAADPDHSLPLLLLDGVILRRGSYPTREQLAGWTGLTVESPAAPATKSSCCGSSGCC